MVSSLQKIGHHSNGGRLVNPHADPASAPNVGRLEEAEILNEKVLLVQVGTYGDTGTALVVLDRGECATGHAEGWMTPGFHFESARQSSADTPNPLYRVRNSARRGRRDHRSVHK